MQEPIQQELILIDEADGVLELRFNRPEKKNAITGAMYDALTAALEDAGARRAVRAVLIAAEGDTFTAGNDIKDFLAMQGGLASTPAGRFIHAIATFEKPLVAAVNGPAIGVGTTMLLHCDLVYASPEASLSVPFVDLGLVPEAGSSLLLPARVGFARAASLLLLGEPMDAEAARTAGLVNAVVPAAALRDHARAEARKLAAKPPQALAATRALMRGEPSPLHAQMRLESAAFSKALQGAEAREAFTAFLERRAPDFNAAALPEAPAA
jgi:enoyl-CoA hydratase/carnithine racemase